MNNTLSNRSTNTLKQTAKMLMDDKRDGTEFALNAVLDELESRMSQDEFITFCDTL